MIILGDLLIESISELQNTVNDGTCNSESFVERSSAFLEIVDGSKSVKHWSSLITLQSTEISNVLRDLSTEVKMENGNFEESKGPSVASEGFNKFVFFEPLIDDKLKIPCSKQGCKSTFLYLRSYKKHMQKYHQGVPLQKVRDPAGTCRLIR